MERLAPAIHHVIAVSNRVLETVCVGFPSTLVANGVDPVHLTRSKPVADVLVFEVPIGKAKKLILEMPGLNVGVEGVYRFQIPVSALRK